MAQGFVGEASPAVPGAAPACSAGWGAVVVVSGPDGAPDTEAAVEGAGMKAVPTGNAEGGEL